MFLNKKTTKSTESYSEKIVRIKECIDNKEAVIIGAGAGLSTAAGLEYGGERFQKLFPEYIEKYELTDMYSSAFYPFETLEEYWGYWCLHVYHNRYAAELNDTYKKLLKLVEGKNYFVITTNGDHLFRLNGFPKERLFYTQGDYGVFACSKGCHNKTYDNEETILKMIDSLEDLKIDSRLIPYCPRCKEPMVVNLRKDKYFVEDEGWERACDNYNDFIKANRNKDIAFIELGVGYNTPSIIKYPFWQMTHSNPKATFISINKGEAICADEIKDKSILIENDIYKVLSDLVDIHV